LGYVAEILLKVAFFRVTGCLASQAVDLKVIKAHASWTKTNFHDVSGLADLLIEERRLQNRAFDPVFAGQLKAYTLAVASHWRETLRYRQTLAEEAELVEVFQSVDWLLANANLLWS